MADTRTYPNIDFVETDTDTIKDSLIQAYEVITGRTLYPADPIRIFILWTADIVAQERVLINESAKQNVLRFAEGDYLDSLAEIFRDAERLEPQAATTTLRFTISVAQTSQIIVPIGTRATVDGTIVFETTEAGTIAIGSTYVDVAAVCQTVGTDGNDFVPGQIATAVDIFPYLQSVANITTSEGGSEEETDSAFYERMRESVESYSTAGPSGAYEYIAKSVNSLISDVKAISNQETITRTLTINNGKAYKGGELLLIDTLIVYPYGSSTAANLTTDYTANYEDGLLTISIVSNGALDGETSIDIAIDQTMEGHVKVYVLLENGQLPGTEILSSVEEALSASKKRPLTDYVTASAPETVAFNIDITYYIPQDSASSATSIQTAVTEAITEYKTWQTSNMGRDINPSYLNYLLMKTGIKRVDISSPVYTAVSDGKVAALGTENIINGGFENE